jgi:hypothetical protein
MFIGLLFGAQENNNKIRKMVCYITSKHVKFYVGSVTSGTISQDLRSYFLWFYGLIARVTPESDPIIP